MIDIIVLLRIAIGVAGFSVFNLRLRKALPTEQWAPSATSEHLDVSLIVPARNEAINLPSLLTSIAALEPGPREVIVVDDHSTDDTAAIAKSFGARLVVPEQLPPGWIGKPWACAAGAAAASSSRLLFTDADTVHAPDLLGRASQALDDRHADLASVIPWHSVVASWERFQGIFQLLLLVATRAGSEVRGLPVFQREDEPRALLPRGGFHGFHALEEPVRVRPMLIDGQLQGPADFNQCIDQIRSGFIRRLQLTGDQG
jgi:4,4'-diaponeurosporenoate glycosyltransferase